MFDAKIIILRCKTKSIFCAPNDPILTTPISAQNVSFGPKCHIFVGKWGGQNRVIWRENNRFCFTSWNDYFCIKHVKRTLINIVWGRKHVIASLKKFKFQCQKFTFSGKCLIWGSHIGTKKWPPWWFVLKIIQFWYENLNFSKDAIKCFLPKTMLISVRFTCLMQK